MQNFKFSAYGMEIEYPCDWFVDLRPKSSFAKADVIFYSEKGARFFVSWGKLEIVESRFRTLEQHADSSLDNLKKTRKANDIRISRRDKMTVDGHDAVFTDAEVDFGERGLLMRAATRKVEMQSFHLHCDQSRRFFVIYNSIDNTSNKEEERANLFEIVPRTFKCHSAKLGGSKEVSSVV